MKKLILLLFLLPTIAFGQTTALSEQLEEAGKELPEKQISFDISQFSSGQLTLPYCEDFESIDGWVGVTGTGGPIPDLSSFGAQWSYTKNDKYVGMHYGPNQTSWVPTSGTGTGVMAFFQDVFTNYKGTFDLTIQLDLSSYTDSNLALSFDYRYHNSDAYFLVKYRSSPSESWLYSYPLFDSTGVPFPFPGWNITDTPGVWFNHSNNLTNLNPTNQTELIFEITDENGNGCLSIDNLCLEVIPPSSPPQTSIGFLSMPPTKDKQLLTIKDILGRTTHPVPNRLLFYLYDDGSVEKRIQLER